MSLRRRYGFSSWLGLGPRARSRPNYGSDRKILGVCMHGDATPGMPLTLWPYHEPRSNCPHPPHSNVGDWSQIHFDALPLMVWCRPTVADWVSINPIHFIPPKRLYREARGYKPFRQVACFKYCNAHFNHDVNTSCSGHAIKIPLSRGTSNTTA